MKHLPLIAAMMATPASAATLQWHMSDNIGNVWTTETGTYTIDGLTITYDRDQYVPYYRASAWWQVIDDDGDVILSGDVLDAGGCPVSGGKAVRDSQIITWAQCTPGVATVTPANPVAPVPHPPALWGLLAGLGMLWRVTA